MYYVSSFLNVLLALTCSSFAMNYEEIAMEEIVYFAQKEGFDYFECSCCGRLFDYIPDTEQKAWKSWIEHIINVHKKCPLCLQIFNTGIELICHFDSGSTSKDNPDAKKSNRHLSFYEKNSAIFKIT